MSKEIGVEEIIQETNQKFDNEEILRSIEYHFSDWIKTAEEQGLKTKKDQQNSYLINKLTEEKREMQKAMRNYLSCSTVKSKEDALEELGDVANQSMILIPSSVKRYTVIENMISSSLENIKISLRNNPFYFLAKKEDTPFKSFIKVIDGTSEFLKKSMESSEVFELLGGEEGNITKTIYNITKLNKDEENYNEELVYNLSHVVSCALIMNSAILGYSYEDFFQRSIMKMEKRDKKYHKDINTQFKDN